MHVGDRFIITYNEWYLLKTNDTKTSKSVSYWWLVWLLFGPIKALWRMCNITISVHNWNSFFFLHIWRWVWSQTNWRLNSERITDIKYFSPKITPIKLLQQLCKAHFRVIQISWIFIFIYTSTHESRNRIAYWIVYSLLGSIHKTPMMLSWHPWSLGLDSCSSFYES